MRCLPENKALGEMGHTDIQNMGCLVTQFGLTSLRQIPQEALCHRDVLLDIVKCLTRSTNRDNSVVSKQLYSLKYLSSLDVNSSYRRQQYPLGYKVQHVLQNLSPNRT